MFCLTYRERKVFLFIGGLILLGSVLRFFNVNLKEPAYEESTSKPLMINVNTASQEELQRLPGVGPQTASRIIQYRKEYSSFSDLENLKEVKGIGTKKLEIIKSYIVFK